MASRQTPDAGKKNPLVNCGLLAKSLTQIPSVDTAPLLKFPI